MTKFAQKRAEKKKEPNYLSFRKKANNFAFMVKQIFKITPFHATFSVIANILDALFNVFIEVYFLKEIISMIENSTDAKTTFHNIVMFGVLGIVVFVANTALQRLTEEVVLTRFDNLFGKRLHSQLFEKATKMELACYDDPKFYNDFVWSMNNSSNLIYQTWLNVTYIVFFLTNMICTGIFIFTTDPIMISFVIASIIVSTALVFWRNKVNYKYSLELNPRIVKRDYIGRVFYLPEYGKEIKLTHIGTLLLKRYSDFIQGMKDVVNKFGKKMAVISSCDGLSWDFFFYIANMIYLAFKAIVKKSLTYSGFIALFNATREFQGSIWNLMQNIPTIDQNSMKINNFRVFMEYEPKMTDVKNAKICENKLGTIKVENLTYTYEGKDKPAIDHVSFEIKPGEKVAIVGYNGAGKSTLIKLLLRLYDPDEGAIYYDGVNIKEYNIKSYREIFGAVFQDYQIFAADVSENVMMDEVKPEDTDTILNALKLSGGYEKIMSLENKLNTQLTREFVETGVNLSGGEAQKVAIARIFAKHRSVVVLDEPSSALDPISEYELNKTMIEAAEGKSVVFISHRLSTTRIADRILMFENGKIIEQGTHDELMMKNGKYADMFILQASNYVDE